MVTFSKDECTPVAAEEGLTGGLAEGGRECCVGCYPTLEDEVLSGLDKEGRAVLTEYKLLSGERLVIVNVYCPHVEEGKPERMDFKLSFYDVLEKRCRALHEAGKWVGLFYSMCNHWTHISLVQASCGCWRC